LQLLPLPQLFVPLQDEQPLQVAHGAALAQPAGAHGEDPQVPQPAANAAAAATAKAIPNLFITNFPLVQKTLKSLTESFP
jgi:hypothetical protein